MGKSVASMATGLGLVALLASAPAQAATGYCWNREDVVAAKILDLRTGLMIAAQRCEAQGHRGNAYATFAGAGRRVLSTATQRLRARFATLYGTEEGGAKLDRFTASLAAAYEGQPVGAEVCAGMASLSREAAAASDSLTGLLEVAERIGVVPALPGGACPVVLASRKGESTASR